MKPGTIAILFLFIFGFGAAPSLLAKSYQMSGLEVEIQLQSDGTMRVAEHREFTFEGRFSEVFRTFPVGGKGTFSRFRVWENNREYAQSDSQSPGTWMAEESGDETAVRIFFDARDTVRTFTIEFEVDGALEKYEDAVLLYYQLISDQWTQPIYNIRAFITPPAPIAAGELAHWVHGSLEADSYIREGGMVEVQLDKLPASRYLEIRSLYPINLFPGMPLLSGEIKPEVMAETANLTREANELRERAMREEIKRQERFKLGKNMAVPLALVVVLVWIWFFRKYRKIPYIQNKEEVFQQLPEKDLPALVSWLYSQTMVTGNALVATLFHLAYRGFLTIKEEENPEKPAKPGKKTKTEIVFYLNEQHLSANRHQLVAFEEELITTLFDGIAGGNNQVTLKQIRKKGMRMQTFFAHWKKAVTDEAEKKHWYDPYSKKGRNRALVVAILLLVAFGASAALWGPWMLIPFGLSLVFTIASLMIYHRTAKGEIAYQQWKNIRKHLKNNQFDLRDERLDDNRINEHIIYGVALALGPSFYNRLFKYLEETHQTKAVFWVLLQHPITQNFSKTINQVITTTSTTLSSATGSGGGGTMGGGGGVASGGGGAR